MLLLDNAVAFRFENDMEDQDTNIARLLDAVENLKASGDHPVDLFRRPPIG